MEGDIIEVIGWLSTTTINETLKDFLSRGDKKEILTAYPELGAISRIKSPKEITAILPSKIRQLGGEELGEVNLARIEGSVVSVWTHKESKYCRLMVYDSHQHPDKNKTHFITVWFKDGRVDGRSIELLPKDSEITGIHVSDRIRVTGPLEELYRPESIREFLLRMKQTQVLTTLPNAGEVGNLTVMRPQSAVLANTIVHYSSRHSYEE
jgi:hypothetical protein